MAAAFRAAFESTQSSYAVRALMAAAVVQPCNRAARVYPYPKQSLYHKLYAVTWHDPVCNGVAIHILAQRHGSLPSPSPDCGKLESSAISGPEWVQYVGEMTAQQRLFPCMSGCSRYRGAHHEDFVANLAHSGAKTILERLRPVCLCLYAAG